MLLIVFFVLMALIAISFVLAPRFTPVHAASVMTNTDSRAIVSNPAKVWRYKQTLEPVSFKNKMGFVVRGDAAAVEITDGSFCVGITQKSDPSYSPKKDEVVVIRLRRPDKSGHELSLKRVKKVLHKQEKPYELTNGYRAALDDIVATSVQQVF